MTDSAEGHLIRLEGAYNVRDLGGYPARQGFHTKRGIFFRGDDPSGLTGGDVERLRQLGITLSVDLRSEQERAQHPSKLKQVDGIRYVSVPMLDHIQSNGLNGDLPSSMATLYLELLDQARDSFRQVFCLFCENTEGAIHFHCTAGKDRTGLTAMLLLELAGTPDRVILEDYAATERYMEPVFSSIIEQMKRQSVTAPVELLRAHPKTMAAALEHIRKFYGTVENYLLGGNLTQEMLDILKNRFLEPDVLDICQK